MVNRNRGRKLITDGPKKGNRPKGFCGRATCQLQHRTALLGMLSGNSGLWDCNDWQCRERWSTIFAPGRWMADADRWWTGRIADPDVLSEMRSLDFDTYNSDGL